MKSKALFAIIFVPCYLDLPTDSISIHNSVIKVFFLAPSNGTVNLMWLKLKLFYDKINDFLRNEYSVIPAAILAFLVKHEFTFMEATPITLSIRSLWLLESCGLFYTPDFLYPYLTTVLESNRQFEMRA
ncbi:unnamed protein product [Haemonchus placei]|uniref:Cyclin_C domain-containing protein n=1 Tax=Haemonchus placei TaxID=6290 RepID=A0A0N4W391_HAEPC|nr:unnamed protein product [Haemonchus placei]